MSTNLPIKSSGRAGRFKKKLVSEDFLGKEAPVIMDKMAPFLLLLHEGKLSHAEFTAIYIVITLSYRFPGAWLGAKANAALVEDERLAFPLGTILSNFEPNIQRRLISYSTIGDIFNHFALKSTPLSVNRSLLQWSKDHYGLELMFRIPKPEEVLNQQKRGRRCVTVIMDKEKASKFILGERDALGFTMHDLIHADHFYQNQECFEGQLGFYGFLNQCMEERHFDELLEIPKFEAEFEYLISDMNAYAVHLLKCFKSALIHYHPKREKFFLNWLARLSVNNQEREAFMALNSPQYESSQDEVLLKFLNGQKFRY